MLMTSQVSKNRSVMQFKLRYLYDLKFRTPKSAYKFADVVISNLGTSIFSFYSQCHIWIQVLHAVYTLFQYLKTHTV